MARYSVAAAKNSFSELIDRARAGEEVVITRRGHPVIRLACAEAVVPHDLSAWHRLQELRESLPGSPVSSVDLLNALYEDDD